MDTNYIRIIFAFLIALVGGLVGELKSQVNTKFNKKKFLVEFISSTFLAFLFYFLYDATIKDYKVIMFLVGGTGFLGRHIPQLLKDVILKRFRDEEVL